MYCMNDMDMLFPTKISINDREYGQIKLFKFKLTDNTECKVSENSCKTFLAISDIRPFFRNPNRTFMYIP